MQKAKPGSSGKKTRCGSKAMLIFLQTPSTQAASGNLTFSVALSPRPCAKIGFISLCYFFMEFAERLRAYSFERKHTTEIANIGRR